MLRSVRNVGRLIGIARTLARHDALFPLEMLEVAPAVTLLARLVSRRRPPGRPGERLAVALQELGPSCIKFGQGLSTRPDLVGEEIAQDLSNLQDKLPPFRTAEARATIERELGAPLAELFTDFEDSPVAAASIAQVHLAATTDGKEAAVKVLRPGIEQAFARDLDLFYWMAELIERTQPNWRRLRPVEVVRTLAESIRLEMDLRLEAAAASELRQNLAGDEGFRVPEVDWRRTARRVLTLERTGGIPIDEREALVAAGHDPDALIDKVVRSFFNQVLRDGFFHADLHAGNLFVDERGDIVAVDFGIMGRLDAETRRYVAEILLGFLNADYERVAEVHFQAGYVPYHKSRAGFTQACRSIGEPILGRPLNDISLARLLAQLFQITEAFAMETQPQLLLLQKTMVVVEGIGRRLNPNVDMWELARPLLESWVRETMSPEAKVREALTEGMALAQRLPRLVADAEAALASIANGGVRLHPETVRAFATERDRRRGSGRAIFWGAVVLAVGVVLAALL
ncbi:MAG: 2-polyprenylphenol 6-hydroxylase [Alphaproteobacteria bacterium]